MKYIAYTQADGTLAIVVPVAGARGADETESAFLSRVRSKDVPRSATDVRVIEDTEVPTDRTYRNAWRDTGGSIAVNMAAAREIHRDHLRQLRKPALSALDDESIRALETKDDAKLAEIIAKKQVLRDAPAAPAIDAARTPDELKAAIPDELRDRGGIRNDSVRNDN